MKFLLYVAYVVSVYMHYNSCIKFLLCICGSLIQCSYVPQHERIGMWQTPRIGDGQMATKKTSAKTSAKTASKRTATASKRNKPVATQDRPARKAYSYSGRVDAIVSGIKSLGGSATLTELFEELHDGADGMFAMPRRIPATLRQHPEARERIANVGGVYSLVKRQRKTDKRTAAKRSKRSASK